MYSKFWAHNRVLIQKLLTAVFLIWPITVLPGLCGADVLVMHSGERFNASRVWEENHTIRFDMNGLIVRVDKSEVADIIRTCTPAGQAANRQKPAQAPVVEDIEVQADNTPRPKAASDPDILGQPPQATQPADPTPLEPIDRPAPRSRRSTTDQQVDTAASSMPRQPPASQLASAVKGTGLQGVTWHMKPADLPGIVKANTEDLFGGIDHYHLPGIDPQFGRAPLDGMLYGFWRNRLYSITCWIAGRKSYELLKAEVFAVYGTGHKNRSGLERFIWQDRGSDRFLEFDDQLNSGIFWMRSRELDRQIKEVYP